MLKLNDEHQMKIQFLNTILFIFLAGFIFFGEVTALQVEVPGLAVNEEDNHVFLPIALSEKHTVNCSSSGLGSILFTERTSGESTGPYLEKLAQEGYVGLVGTPTYSMGAEYFDKLPGWDRASICNSLDCLRHRAERADDEGLDYEYLSYGPERLGGVPEEEKYNLPWATQEARKIADQWNKPLMISYSTVQLHQEAEERGYHWNDPSEVVAMLAPFGDAWVIQAADEYWRLEDNTIRPVLSQRVYPPGKQFRTEVERWVKWIREANPDIKIWIQLAMQRIGIEGENYPSADLLLEYRNSIADLVDGIYMMPIYGSIEQLPIANQEMVEVFHRACDNEALIDPSATIQSEHITLVDEGWSDDVEIPCSPSGDCMTILPGYYYRIFENSKYPCGSEGYHQFMVVDNELSTDKPKHIFAKFLGGAVGFWYYDENDQRVYYPHERGVGLLTEDYFRKMFFRTSLSEEYANGVTKKFRENEDFRIVLPSYCSHDLYHGSGEFSEVDGFNRWGYSAGMEAVDFAQRHFNTKQVITYGGSAGAAGAFYIGKDQENVAAIIMDSQAVDLSAISEACHDGINVFGNAYPCYCPDGGETCMEVLVPRIGFNFFSDEPYRYVEKGFDKPIYYVWNERDASRYAYLQFENLHNAINQYNPGGNSVANMVCITDPRTPPGPICNLHVPSAYDFAETETLVSDIYNWSLQQFWGDYSINLHLPLLNKH